MRIRNATRKFCVGPRCWSVASMAPDLAASPGQHQAARHFDSVRVQKLPYVLIYWSPSNLVSSTSAPTIVTCKFAPFFITQNFIKPPLVEYFHPLPRPLSRVPFSMTTRSVLNCPIFLGSRIVIRSLPPRQIEPHYADSKDREAL